MRELTGWEGFYGIVGSAAATLIGLQFVVMTLIAQRPPVRAAEAGAAAFATPTIVHFSAVLLLATLLRAPWWELALPAALWGLMGAAGVLYTAIVAWRMKKQSVYEPCFEDWLFHALLPGAAYALLVASSVGALTRTTGALFGAGAAALLLLFSSIHNAWDGVAYHVLVNLRDMHGAPGPGRAGKKKR